VVYLFARHLEMMWLT